MLNKIIQTNYGLSSVYSTEEGTITEINYKLYGDLREKILKHERKHSVDRHYDKNDFKTDFMSENSYFFESFKFCVHNPECWINFFPFMYSYYAKNWSINYSAFVPFGYFGLIFIGFFWIFLRTNIFISFIGYVLFVAFLNLALLYITHRYVKRDSGFVYKEILE